MLIGVKHLLEMLLHQVQSMLSSAFFSLRMLLMFSLKVRFIFCFRGLPLSAKDQKLTKCFGYCASFVDSELHSQALHRFC